MVCHVSLISHCVQGWGNDRREKRTMVREARFSEEEKERRLPGHLNAEDLVLCSESDDSSFN